MCAEWHQQQHVRKLCLATLNNKRLSCVFIYSKQNCNPVRAILILISVNPLISVTLKQKVCLPLDCWKVLEQGRKGTQGEVLPELIQAIFLLKRNFIHLKFVRNVSAREHKTAFVFEGSVNSANKCLPS